MTSSIKMYATRTCPYCVRAERLLLSLGATDIQKVLVDGDPALMEEMIQLSGRRSVPQIFIAGEHVGGADDLYRLHEAGRLRPMLDKPSAP